MNRPERKRGFSQAFQIARSALPSRQTQVLKTVASPELASPGFCSPPWLEGPDKENQSPLEISNVDLLMPKDTSQPNFHYSSGLTTFPPQHIGSLAIRGRPLQSLTELPRDGGHARRLTPLPGGRDPFVPDLNVDFSAPINGNILGYLDAEPGFSVHEDNFSMDGFLAPVGPLTPSELNIQDLSLVDLPQRLLSHNPLRPVIKQNRTSVHVVPTADWTSAFPNLTPSSIIVVFAKGKQALTIDKYPLCAASRYFTSILDGPFLHGYIRLVRLRNDFPHAIKAMLQFINTGTYTFAPAMKAEHPNITMLDLHVHAYVVGVKYDIPSLCEHAMGLYITLAQMCLSMQTEITSASGQTSTYALNAARIILGQFVDSLALVRRNTNGRGDELRDAVLELIKSDINRLLRTPAFAALMMGLEDFGADILGSLRDDGLKVAAFVAHRGGVRFA